MLDNRKRSEVNNNKILDWRLELASFCYTVKYQPSKDNVAPYHLRKHCCQNLDPNFHFVRESAILD